MQGWIIRLEHVLEEREKFLLCEFHFVWEVFRTYPPPPLNEGQLYRHGLFLTPLISCTDIQYIKTDSAVGNKYCLV